jgi:hypothetical protein
MAGIMLGKLSRQLAIQLQEQRQNLKQGHPYISILVQHDYEEGHWIGWNEANILQTRPNTRYKKYKESVHVAYWETTISQPSFDTSPILGPLISKEVDKKHGGTWLL